MFAKKKRGNAEKRSASVDNQLQWSISALIFWNNTPRRREKKSMGCGLRGSGYMKGFRSNARNSVFFRNRNPANNQRNKWIKSHEHHLSVSELLRLGRRYNQGGLTAREKKNPFRYDCYSLSKVLVGRSKLNRHVNCWLFSILHVPLRKNKHSYHWLDELAGRATGWTSNKGRVGRNWHTKLANAVI